LLPTVWCYTFILLPRSWAPWQLRNMMDGGRIAVHPTSRDATLRVDLSANLPVALAADPAVEPNAHQPPHWSAGHD